jgi:hypothetical protein
MKSYLMRIFIVILPVMLICHVHGQDQSVSFNKEGYGNHHMTVPDVSNSSRHYSDISSGSGENESIMQGEEGNAYLFDDWKPGYVVLKDNSRIDDLQFRYNIYFHQMQFIHEGDTLAFSDPGEIAFFMFGNQKMIYTDYFSEGQAKMDFFCVLHEGKYSLLKRYLVKYHETADPANPECNKDVFINCCELYLKTENEPAQQINCSKKGILNAFSDKKAEIKAFMKINKLSARDHDDLLTILKYYNTLNDPMAMN